MWPFKRSIIYGRQNTPYMKRLKLNLWGGKVLRIHTIYRADEDKDPHTHPFGFWTFPLRGYTEEVYTQNHPSRPMWWTMHLNHVKPFRWHWRPVDYVHRITNLKGKTLTIVIADSREQDWGFFQKDWDVSPRLTRRTFVPWRKYLDLL